MASIFASLFLVFLRCLVFGFRGEAKHYDHSFNTECLEMPQSPLYDGGLVVNSEFNEGLYGWRPFGYSKIEHRVSSDGNNYIVATERTRPHQSFSQKFHIHNGMHYTFSAWIRASHEKALVGATLKGRFGHQHIAWGIARAGCWSMMKGGLSANTSGRAYLYFETENTDIEIWADSISLQVFTHEEWVNHQRHNVEKGRKTNVQLQVVDRAGRPVPNATVSINQLYQSFPFGCAINHNILYYPAYQDWFLRSGFTTTVFENELKWYSTEPVQGQENYFAADALMQFAQSHGIQVRGHNVFWDNVECQPGWVPGLWSDALQEAAERRMHSVVNKYKGQLIHWDVMNEMLHFDFFESRLGDYASINFYNQASQLDGEAIMFMNDYNTIENCMDGAASPAMYMEKIRALRAASSTIHFGIGVESHFACGNPNLAYARAALDQLAQTGLPVWITELDVAKCAPEIQAAYLKQILPELMAHGTVNGMMLWGAWSPMGGCYQMCLTDDNFNNLKTGDVVEGFVKELAHANEMPGVTDFNGFYQKSLYHGEYKITISDQNGKQISNPRQIQVRPREEMQHVHRLIVEPLY